MARALRLQYPGALYHVTARGVRQDAIFLDDRDRAAFMAILARALKACDAQAYAYCLMGNHYHLVLQTRQANLAALIHRVNSPYSLVFNRRHDRQGHVFEGRAQVLHVDRDAYLLAVCRYVDLNPVRAGLVESPVQWRWSSYRSHVGKADVPAWLATAELHGVLVGQDACAATAQGRYADWVQAGTDVKLWREALREGRYVGDEAFVQSVKSFRT